MLVVSDGMAGAAGDQLPSATAPQYTVPPATSRRHGDTVHVTRSIRSTGSHTRVAPAGIRVRGPWGGGEIGPGPLDRCMA